MATIYRGATLTPHFRDFLGPWVARQEWFLGTDTDAGTPELRPVGTFRFEDPAGAVGMETHLLTDGTTLYQVPLTYRDAQKPGADPDDGLISTAEHSVLGTRWIYDATTDPVWVAAVLRTVRDGAEAEPGAKSGLGPASAQGRPLRAFGDDAVLDVVRTPPQRESDDDAIAGLLIGTWCPQWPDPASVSGCLATLRG